MKYMIIVLAGLAVLSCGKTSDHQTQGGTNGDEREANRVLYDQVMEIHDAVMPRMDDLYRLKTGIQDSIAKTPGLTPEQKTELETMVATLDSVDQAMRIWMREFNPLPDSADQEAARAYLEGQIEQIKEIRDFTDESINKAKAIAGKH